MRASMMISRALLFAGAVACTASLNGCSSSVVTSSSPDWNIINGSAFDTTSLDPGKAQTLRVPEGTRITPNSPDGIVHIYIKKTLNWSGHPNMPTDIHYERYKMGCAWRRGGEVLTIATYGEYDSKAEGGAYVTLAVVTPPDLKVETRKELSGPDSPVEIQEPIFDSLQTRPWNAGWMKFKEQEDKTLGAGNFK